MEEADMNEKMRNEIEQLIQKEVARAVFQERLRVQREKQRQEALVREQKKQYSRLGFCFTAFFWNHTGRSGGSRRNFHFVRSGIS